jgi:hypothetical protein
MSSGLPLIFVSADWPIFRRDGIGRSADDSRAGPR